MITHEQYKLQYLGKRIDYDGLYGYQCVDLAKHYCKLVWGYTVGSFGGSAYTGWLNKLSAFPGKKYVEGFDPTIPVGSVVIFKAGAVLQRKKPGFLQFWKTVKLTSAGHVAIVDYMDTDGIIRVVEQNGDGGANGLGNNAIRLMGYKGKDAVAGFIRSRA